MSSYHVEFAAVSWWSKKCPYTHKVVNSDTGFIICVAPEFNAELIADVLTLHFNTHPDHYPESKL